MSRKRKAPKRLTVIDPKYKSSIIPKLINSIMYDGKKTIAEKIIYDAIGKKKSKENDMYSPSSPYSASKASADHLVKSYIRTYNINAVISNCCNNYGPYQFPEKLLPKMIANIIANKELPIYAKGKNSREWIHVNDHCEALFMLYLKGRSGQSYNVGSGINLKNIDLVKKLLKLIRPFKIKIGKKVGKDLLKLAGSEFKNK